MYFSFAADIDHFRSILQMSDPGNKVPCDRHSGFGLKDDQVTNEKIGGPSSILPVDTVFGRSFVHCHKNFQQAIARPNDHTHPPRSCRAWYNVDGLPMAQAAQVENPDLPTIQRQFPYRNLHARIRCCDKLRSDVLACAHPLHG